MFSSSKTLTNLSTLEVIIERLLEWAHENYSKSLNQPIKPHVIIAFNKSTNQTADDQWSELNATANLLDAANAQIHQNATFVRFAQRWKQLHYKVDTMKKLMECYYSSVHVVRLPHKDRYQLLHQQRQVLQDRIQWCCQQTRQDKEERGLLTDVDEFGMYLSLAFDHFSETLDKPFNFVEASLMRNPLSLSFPADMRYFVKELAERLQVRDDIKILFTSLTSLVASCILLNAARKKHIGKALKNWCTEVISANTAQADQKIGSATGRMPNLHNHAASQAELPNAGEPFEHIATSATTSYPATSRKIYRVKESSGVGSSDSRSLVSSDKLLMDPSIVRARSTEILHPANLSGRMILTLNDGMKTCSAT